MLANVKAPNVGFHGLRLPHGRRAIVRVSLEALAGMLRLPPGFEVLAALPSVDGLMCGTIDIGIQSPDLPEVPEGERPPYAIVAHRRDHDGRVHLDHLLVNGVAVDLVDRTVVASPSRTA